MSRRLLEAAGDAVARDPARGLTAVRRLRREVDRTEETQVANALAAGWSWARIGRALGVTRQAVHRKYSGCPPLAEPLGPAVTNGVRITLMLARFEAAARGDALAGTEHVVLAMLQQGEGRAARALRDAGADLRVLRRVADALFPGGVCEVTASHMSLTRRARASLDQAVREASRAAEGRVCDHHLLRALLEDGDSGAARLLAGAGIAREEVLAGLADDSTAERERERAAA